MNDRTDQLLEKLLILRVQAREPGAFSLLVARYEKRILYYIHRLVGSGSDREDILQEVWMTVFLRIHTLNSPEAFRVWLYKIAHDISITHLRRRNGYREEAQTDDRFEVVDPSDSSDLELLESAQLVHDGLAMLSVHHREILTLRFLEDLDLGEIASIVGCPVGTVKSRLHFAKSILRRFIEEQNHD